MVNFFFASQVDIPSLITLKLLKVSMKHIEIIAKARQKGISSRMLVRILPDGIIRIFNPKNFGKKVETWL